MPSATPSRAASQLKHTTKFLSAISAASSRCRLLPAPPPRSRSSAAAAYNSLMSSFARAGRTKDVLRIFNHIKLSSPHSLSVHHYNTLLNSLFQYSCVEDAYSLLDEMLASGIKPSVVTYTIQLKHEFQNASKEDIYKFIDRMERIHGCVPDAVTYSVLIDFLCRAGRLQEAWGLVDYMLDQKLVPTVRAFTCILRGYCSEGKINVAKNLLGTMEQIGCSPDTFTYSVLIEALCERGDFEEVERILSESKPKGWTPNEVTYNIFMSGLCRFGKVDEAFCQLDAMIKSGLCPTVETLNILFDCLCKDSKVWEAWFLLERSAELGWDVDVFNYNTLMSRLCDIGDWKKVLTLLTNIVKRGIGPDACTFTIVIRCLCMAGKFLDAECIIKSKWVLADVVTYNTLMHWFYKERKFSEVKSLVFSMEKEWLAPNLFTYCIIIDTLCSEGKFSEAVECFLRSLRYSFMQKALIRLIFWLIKGARLKELLVLFDGILFRGCHINVFIFISMIKAFCRNGYCKSTHVDKITIILERMLRTR